MSAKDLIVEDMLRNDLKIAKPKPNGHWAFPEQMGKPAVGFVYLIRDPILKRFYIGKKYYERKHRGFVADSNWKNYVSSSGTLKAMFVERSLDEFEFIALEQYSTRGTVSYAETWSLCHVEAPTTNTWYNVRIEKVSWAVKEPITERHKDRLARAINMESFEGEWVK